MSQPFERYWMAVPVRQDRVGESVHQFGSAQRVNAAPTLTTKARGGASMATDDLSPTISRFWSYVSVPAGFKGCRLWTSCINSKGYGHFNIGNDRIVRAHRLAWELTYGSIPAGLCVLHKCDTRACCRPDHLFLGTPADNMADMVRKGRSFALGRASPGEKNGIAKLTEQAVREIRVALAEGESQCKIAVRYGVASTTVSRVARRKGWGHVK